MMSKTQEELKLKIPAPIFNAGFVPAAIIMLFATVLNGTYFFIKVSQMISQQSMAWKDLAWLALVFAIVMPGAYIYPTYRYGWIKTLKALYEEYKDLVREGCILAVKKAADYMKGNVKPATEKTQQLAAYLELSVILNNHIEKLPKWVQRFVRKQLDRVPIAELINSFDPKRFTTEDLTALGEEVFDKADYSIRETILVTNLKWLFLGLLPGNIFLILIMEMDMFA